MVDICVECGEEQQTVAVLQSSALEISQSLTLGQYYSNRLAEAGELEIEKIMNFAKSGKCIGGEWSWCSPMSDRPLSRPSPSYLPTYSSGLLLRKHRLVPH